MHDFIVIGSGFGGAVSALRLSEKGYQVHVLEAGKRYRSEDFPKTNWKVWKFLWMPRLFLHGIQRLTLLKDVLILSGAGVGGGSLVYANTLLVPPEKVFSDPRWPAGIDWKVALTPFYALAKRMLGVTPTPALFAADHVLKAYAEEIGRADTFHSANVGVFFGTPNQTVKDPFFSGEGPDRTGCNFCGGCMVGCRFGAKNTLDKNYLWLAEKRGATIEPETIVTLIEEKKDGGYLVHVESSTAFFFKKKRVLETKGIVLAAGVLGTVRLLLQCQQKGSLPRLSKRLGDFVRTNSEALVGARGRGDSDYSSGIAITSGVYVNDHTHIEVVRYPKGSDVMASLSTLLTDNGTRLTRPLRFLGNILLHPMQFLRSLIPFGWAQHTIILLVMQTIDSSMRLALKRRWFWPFSRGLTTEGSGAPPVPVYIREANEAAKSIAKRIGGTPQSAVNEVVLNVATTAHILGGCPMGNTAEEGVIDAQRRLFGYENAYVVDGSTIPVNLGVNPSLTITALAEHAMSQVPDKPGATLPPKVVFEHAAVTARTLLCVLAVGCASRQLERPASALHLHSTRFPLWVHAPRDHLALAETVLGEADAAWQAEIASGEWPAPLPDAAGVDADFDIYLDESLGVDRADTNGEDSAAAPGDAFAEAAYVVLSTRFSSDGVRESTVAHELNHASQYALDAAEDDAFFEHTAVFVERRLGGEAWAIGVGDYQRHPERALTFIGDDHYEYGAALWLSYLSTLPGGDALVQALWLGSRQAGRKNSPHFLDALDGLLAERQLTRAAFFAGYAAWRYFQGEVVADAEVPVRALDLGRGADAELGAFGAAYFLLDEPPALLGVEASARAALALVAVTADGRAVGPPVLATPVQSMTWRRPEDCARLLVALTRVEDDFDPGTRDFVLRRTHVVIASPPGSGEGVEGGHRGGRKILGVARDEDAPVHEGGGADESFGLARTQALGLELGAQLPR